MKLKLRFICGILTCICIDIFLFIYLLFPSKISLNWIYICIFPVFIIGIILNKKIGYLLDKYEKECYIFGAIIGFITLIIFIFYGIYK